MREGERIFTFGCGCCAFCSFPNTGNLRFVLICCSFSMGLPPLLAVRLFHCHCHCLSPFANQNFCIFSFSENVQRDLFFMVVLRVFVCLCFVWYDFGFCPLAPSVKLRVSLSICVCVCLSSFEIMRAQQAGAAFWVRRGGIRAQINKDQVHLFYHKFQMCVCACSSVLCGRIP